MKTQPRDTPRPTKPLTELMSGAGGRTQTTCPSCHRAHAFLVTNTYQLTGAKRRLRQCRVCGHAQDELCPPPVIGGETSFSAED